MAKDLPTFLKQIESGHPDELRRVTRDADPANHDVTVGADAPVEDVVLTVGAPDPASSRSPSTPRATRDAAPRGARPAGP